MKTHYYLRAIAHITLLVLLCGSRPAQGQERYTGDWEGMFMVDFRTVIRLNCDKENKYAGKILMFDGSNQIQDDEIFKIKIEANKLTFYIQAKETHYEGAFNQETNELSGLFIFPDGSEHPLVTRKVLHAISPPG